MPIVSIITPLFNKGTYVAETVASVRAQTTRHWELIVVENGSTDDGPEQVLRLASQDGRIRLVSSPSRGPGAARNFGLTLATGEWVLFLDADDLIAPAYLSDQMSVATAHPETQIVAGSWQEFEDATPAKRSIRRPPGWGQECAFVSQAAIAFAPWALHAALVRRDWLGGGIHWFKHLDGWPSEDTAFWFSVLQGASVAWSESTGAFYRVNTPDSRNSGKDAKRWFEGLRQVVETNLATLAKSGRSATASERVNIMRTFENHYRKALKDGDDEYAAHFLDEATRRLGVCGWTGSAIALRRIFGIRLITKVATSRLAYLVLRRPT